MNDEFYGTKRIKALPMTRLEYNEYRGWALPDDENGADDGYLVEYLDGGAPNHPEHAGYISWSPRAQFDRAYQCVSSMSFSHALAAIKDGEEVARVGWNGPNAFLFLVSGSQFKVNRPPLNKIYEEGTEIAYHAHIDMMTTQGYVVPWFASQSDVLAEDWYIVTTNRAAS